MRHVAGAALVLLAAVIVHRTGHTVQLRSYIVIAVALLPQVGLDALAMRDPRRLARLRVSGRPALVPCLKAIVLALAAATTLVFGTPPTAWAAGAAFCAAAGLAVAAAPVTVLIAARPA